MESCVNIKPVHAKGKTKRIEQQKRKERSGTANSLDFNSVFVGNCDQMLHEIALKYDI